LTAESLSSSPPPLPTYEEAMLLLCSRVRPIGRLLGTLGNQYNGEGTRLMVICLLILNPGMKQVKLAETLNISPAAVQRHIMTLRESGAISDTSAVNIEVLAELVDFLSDLVQIARDYKTDKFRRDLPCQVRLINQINPVALAIEHEQVEQVKITQ
jgi:predicted transcriptional regulator